MNNMAEPFLAEIRIMGFNFAPRGWATCDGQILPINQNQSLYSLLGTTYGGDGRTTFGLPNLRGRTPIHRGSSNGTSYSLGDIAGEETHTLAANEMPMHTHTLRATDNPAASDQPTGNVFSNASANVYAQFGTTVAMNASSVLSVGGGQSHNNMQPCLALNFCIALQGLFPSRS